MTSRGKGIAPHVIGAKPAPARVTIDIEDAGDTPILREYRLVKEQYPDAILLARQLFADADWANKAKAGLEDDIRRCVAANYCWRSVIRGGRVQCVYNPAVGREASWAGAGIIYPGNFARATTPFNRLLAYSVSHYPALSAELRDCTGIDNGYHVCGGLEFD